MKINYVSLSAPASAKMLDSFVEIFKQKPKAYGKLSQNSETASS